jgi:hypothetical protein
VQALLGISFGEPGQAFVDKSGHGFPCCTTGSLVAGYARHAQGAEGLGPQVAGDDRLGALLKDELGAGDTGPLEGMLVLPIVQGLQSQGIGINNEMG